MEVAARRTIMGMLYPMLIATAMSLLSAVAVAADWPQFGGHDDRNAVSTETGLPDRFDETSGKPDGTALKNVKWVVRLGGIAYGSPVVSGGKVFIGGAAQYRANAMLWCLRESDGKMLWRMRSPFWQCIVNRTFGICSTPTVEGDRVYLLGQHGEVLCLDANGLNGRAPSDLDLEMLSKREYPDRNGLDPDGKRLIESTKTTPGVPEATDAHVLWRFDMLREVNCWPYNAQSGGILIRGDRLYIPTGTTRSEYGKDGSIYWIDRWKEKYGKSSYPSPSLIVLDKNTGKLLAKDEEGIFETTFHGAHASPAFGTVNGKQLLFYGGGNGSCYAFDPDFQAGSDGGVGVLKRVWKFDCLAAASYDGGYSGPRLSRAEVMASPVFYKNRVYVSIGNDLNHDGKQAEGGRLLCLDATRTGDITATGRVWSFDTIRSTSSTVVIADGLLYTADAAGKVYCLDADTGKLYWEHDSGVVWSSPLVADGKVFFTQRYSLLTFAVGKEKKLLAQTKMHEELASTPAAANGVLYVANAKFLYALQAGKTGTLDQSLSPWSPPESDGRNPPKEPKGFWYYTLRIGLPAVGVLLLVLAMLRLARRRRQRREAQKQAASGPPTDG